MRFHITEKTTNRKTGPMPVVTVSAETCPDTCALKAGGCYAKGGPLAIHWRKVTDGTAKGVLSFTEFLERIRKFPEGLLWRYGQAGEIPDSPADVLALAEANAGRPVICYTHKRDFPTYRETAKLGMNINLSADNLIEADTLADTGLPVVVVLPADTGIRKDEAVSEYRARLGGKLGVETPNGRKVAICPATYTETNCLACAVCSTPRPNGTIIGFPAHGSKKASI